MWLSRSWCGWRSAVHIVKPETVMGWRRRGFRLFWRWKSRHRTGRPGVPEDVRDLIRELSTANPLWGAHPRRASEAGDLRQSIDRRQVHQPTPTPAVTNVSNVPDQSHLTLSETTVAKYLGRRRCPVAYVAYLPRQPRHATRLGGLLHRPDRHLSGVVCVRGVIARPMTDHTAERHGASDRGVDRTTAPRGVAVGDRAAIPVSDESAAGHFTVSRKPWTSPKR